VYVTFLTTTIPCTLPYTQKEKKHTHTHTQTHRHKGSKDKNLTKPDLPTYS